MIKDAISTADAGLRPNQHALVIGGGFGGLALAIRLQASGIPTKILEARDKPGGRAYVFEQDGFRFDAGPTVLTAPGVIDELFAMANRRRAEYIEFETLSPFYRLLWQDDTQFDYIGDEDELEARHCRVQPDRCRRLPALSSIFTRGFCRGL